MANEEEKHPAMISVKWRRSSSAQSSSDHPVELVNELDHIGADQWALGLRLQSPPLEVFQVVAMRISGVL